MFIKAPKVNFGGYYRLKEKYWHECDLKSGMTFVRSLFSTLW